MKTRDLSNGQLVEYFSEHVRYEIQMLLNATYAINRGLEVPNGLQHMPVESFAIHLRNLISFLYPVTLRDNDICAKDFFEDEATWLRIRCPLSPILETAKKRADLEVGHLTTLRQAGTPITKFWDVEALTREIQPIFESFARAADKVDLRALYQPIADQFSLVFKNLR